MNALESSIAAKLADEDMPAALVKWLAGLKILQGVPFNYLVPDERLLEPESLKFFQLDPLWLDAILDGALSIGRHFSNTDTPSPSLVGEQAQRARLGDAVHAEVPELRRRQLKLEAASPAMGASVPGSDLVTGFLLRSRAVSGWKSMDVAAYAQGSSPYEAQRGTIPPEQVQTLQILRLERLSPTVLLGLFKGALFELTLHEPPEAVHFGVQTIDLTASSVTKALRVPATNWDDPAATFDTQAHPHETVTGVFADTTNRVVDMSRLSQAVAGRLNDFGKAPGYYASVPDDNHQDHLLSSDFALEMVQGVGLVSFINAGLPAQVSR